MEKVYEELDDAKAEIERLKAELRGKTDSIEKLKKFQNAQVNQIQEAKLKIDKLDQELLQKADEVTEAKQNYEDLKGNLNKKESIIKHLSAANDKLRVDCDEKFKKWEDERKELVLALEEAIEKAENQEQQVHEHRQEIESLKGCVSVSASKKCLEVQKKAKASKEQNERDDMFEKLEDENRKVAEQLKWKKEQFKHLEEAHEKVREQFRSSKKEWELEKSTFLDEISSLQIKLDSQTRISDDLQHQLQMCNQALAHEECRRKHLEVQVSDFKARFENVSGEYQDARLQLDHLNSERDKDIGDLRYSLKTKEAHYKEMKYSIGKLEQENQELRMSLKELQEAQIQEAGASFSQSKLRPKLRNLEQVHRECNSTLKAKEAEWNLQLEKLARELDAYRSELENKTEAIEELNKELESSHSLTMELKLLNEEMSVMLLVVKLGISEAQLKLANDKEEMDLINKEREEKCSQLMKNAALIRAQKDISEEREKAACAMRKVETLGVTEEQQNLLQHELERCKKMLEESTECQFLLEEKVLQMEEMDPINKEREEKCSQLLKQLEMKNAALIRTQKDISEEREKAACAMRKVESLGVTKEQQNSLQNELERCKKMLEESTKCQFLLEEKVLQMEEMDPINNEREEKCSQLMKQLEMKNAALIRAQKDINEEREKAACAMRKVESLGFTKEQQNLLQNELERCKKMLEESTKCQLLLEEKVLQMESDSKEKLRQVSDALDRANTELYERICEGNEMEFELQIWKLIAERWKTDLEENHVMRKELETSLLAQVDHDESLKQEKDNLIYKLEENERRIDDLQQQVIVLEQELKARQTEASIPASGETAVSSETDELRYLRIIEEKDKILKELQKEVGLLEQESFEREFESAVVAKSSTEQTYKPGKEHLMQLVEGKKLDMDELMQQVASLGKQFTPSLVSFSSQLAGKQAEINLVMDACDKITAAEILAMLETEEKKLMIAELEDDIHDIEQKLKLQEESWSHSEQLALEIEAEMEAKQLQIKELTDQMETKLKNSDALYHKLKMENRNLLENVTNLSSERENLLSFIMGLDEKICEFSTADTQLMDTLRSMVQSFENDSPGMNLIKDCGFLVKENIKMLSPVGTKKLEAIFDVRSPFKELNN